MRIDEIKTGHDLYRYITQFLEKKNIESQILREKNILTRIKGDRIYEYPHLLDYLLSLWATAEKYKEQKITFSLIAQMLEEAFVSKPKVVNWDELLKVQYTPPYDSEANTPEYHEEIAQYTYFEKNIRNYVVSLKMVVTYGMKKLGVPDYAERPDGEWGKYYWENHTTEIFLERGISFLEDEDDWYSDDPKYKVSWSTVESVLNNGRFEE